MMKNALLIFLITPLLLTACSGVNVQKTALQPTITPPTDAKPSPIGLNKFRINIKTGTPIASTSPKGLLGLFSCAMPYGPRSININRGNINTENLRQIFYDTLEGQGYDITGNPGLLFDEAEDYQRTIYAIGGVIKDVKIDTCEHSNIWGIKTGTSGEGSVTVEWTIYDMLHRKKIYKTTTNGYANLKHKNLEGFELLIEDAIAAAIHNLGADQSLHNLAFYGTMPIQNDLKNSDPFEDATGQFDPQEPVNIATRTLSKKSVTGRLETITKTAVQIETGGGHGSGFFITKDGHILTNAHVVGYAKRVRITTSRKSEKLIAEVLRVDRKRDVALLKLEELPKDYQIQTLPIKTTNLKIGSNIYAIGAPAYKKLQDTVTKGIVSSYRYSKKEKQWDIQGDAFTYGGNSGGPLIDGYGNIVGITYAGYIDGTKNLSGLNLFIPIADALGQLDITLGGQAITFTPPK